MSQRVAIGTGVSPTWSLPYFLLRTAWAEQPFDVLTEWFSDQAEAHLLEVVGDPVLTDVPPGAGPVSLLPELLAMLRTPSEHRGPERLSLLTGAAGDTSALPPVAGLRDDVLEAGSGVLVRDPVGGSGVCLTARDTGGGVLRWRARGIGVCPVAPQPLGPGRANAELASAVEEAASLIERAPATSSIGTTPRGPDVSAAVARLPDGLDSRTVSLLDRADRVEAIVGVALRLPDVGAAQAEREPVLRRLVRAVDAARRSAVASAAEEALGR